MFSCLSLLITACAPQGDAGVGDQDPTTGGQVINSFESCVAAGNPVLESYPRQCQTEKGEIFVERIEAGGTVPETIGGQRDAHGCLVPAGYMYDEQIMACVRGWELTDSTREAAKIAVAHLGPAEGLTVVEVGQLQCLGCYEVVFDKMQERVSVRLDDWKVAE